MSSLGECKECRGPLCVATRRREEYKAGWKHGAPPPTGAQPGEGPTVAVLRGVVACDSCGKEYPDHPMSPKGGTREEPARPVIEPVQMENSLADRVRRLEQRLAAAEARLATLPSRKAS
jgi:uncharacterized protein YbaR (Trm112 family)